MNEKQRLSTPIKLTIALILILIPFTLKSNNSSFANDESIALTVAVNDEKTDQNIQPLSNHYMRLNNPHTPLETIKWQQIKGMHPPLYFLVLNTWARLVSVDSPILIRLPNVLFALITLLFMGKLARALSNQRASYIILLMAISPWFIGFICYLRPYCLVLSLVSASTWFCYQFKSDQSNNYKSAIIYTILASLGLYTHYYFVFLIAWHFLWNIVTFSQFSGQLRKQKFKQLTLIAIGIALLFSPWLPTFIKHLEVTRNPKRYFNTQYSGIHTARFLVISLLIAPYILFLYKRIQTKLTKLAFIIGVFLGALFPWFLPSKLTPFVPQINDLGNLEKFYSYWINHAALGWDTANSPVPGFSLIWLLALVSYILWLRRYSQHISSTTSNRTFWLLFPALPLLVVISDCLRNSSSFFLVKQCFVFTPMIFLVLVDVGLGFKKKALRFAFLALWTLVFLAANIYGTYQNMTFKDKFLTAAERLATSDSKDHLIVVNTVNHYTLNSLILAFGQLSINQSDIVAKNNKSMEPFLNELRKSERYKRITVIYIEGSGVPVNELIPLLQSQCDKYYLAGWNVIDIQYNQEKTHPNETRTFAIIPRIKLRKFSH
jgi:uncharacterized membrane protein